MGVQNVARVWAPTLLQSPFGDVRSREDVQSQIKTVAMLLKMPADMWEKIVAEVRMHVASVDSRHRSS